MGGERSSTSRQRLSGKICCWCQRLLDPPYPGRERHCDRCGPKRRIYMHFMSTATGWQCQFLEEDLKKPLRRRLTFQDPGKIEEMAEKGGAVRTSEGTQIMEHSLKQGRGSVWLNLTEKQYGGLK